MKREYTKPQVIVEDYCLSESVAQCESVFVNTYNNNIDVDAAWAALTGPFFGLFSAGTCNSDASTADESVFAGFGVCYHTYNAPTGSQEYHFNS